MAASDDDKIVKEVEKQAQKAAAQQKILETNLKAVDKATEKKEKK